MKKSFIKKGIALTTMMFGLSLLASCNETKIQNYNTDVVKAFNVIKSNDQIISQTAVGEDNSFLVTLITDKAVVEYNVSSDFTIENSTAIVGEVPTYTSTEMPNNQPTVLERVYTEALNLSQIAANEVVSFDFDQETYMGELVYKVEIEDVQAEYTYVFKATDFSLVDSKTKLKGSQNKTESSYISETQAQDIAFSVVGIKDSEATNLTIKSVLSNGRKLYKVSFDYDNYRYQVDADAVSGAIVKYSKNILDSSVTNENISEIIDENTVKQIALDFVFKGEPSTDVTFLKVKLDYEHRTFVYEVEFVANNNEYEFEIDAYNGTIIDVEMEVHDDLKLPANNNFISQEEALNKVKEYVNANVTVLEVEVEKEHVNDQQMYYYEIEVRVNNQKREFQVDAITGEVIEKNASHDDHHASVTGLISQQEAINALKAKLGDSIVIKEIELEDKGIGANKKYYYEAEVILNGREYDYYVDAITSEVFSKDELLGSSQNIISEQEAIDLALKHFSLTTNEALILKVELDDEDDMLIYEIKFMVKDLEYTVELNATNGQIVDVDISFD